MTTDRPSLPPLPSRVEEREKSVGQEMLHHVEDSVSEQEKVDMSPALPRGYHDGQNPLPKEESLHFANAADCSSPEAAAYDPG